MVLAVAGVLALAACNPSSVAVEQGWSAPVVDEGSVFIGSRAGKFLSFAVNDITEASPLNLKDKSLNPKWKFPKTDDISLGAIYGDAALTPDRVFVVLNKVEKRTQTGLLYSLDRRTGDQQWSKPTEGRIFGSPVVQDGVIYVADDEGIVYTFSAEDGTSLGKEQVAEKRFWTTPTVADGVVYIGSMDKKLYALDAKTLKPKWDQPFAADGAIVSRPLVTKDSVYVGAFDRKFYRIDKATGQKRKEFDGAAWFWNDAVLSPDGGLVFVGSLGGTIFALKADTLEEVKRFSTESSIRGAPVKVGNSIYWVLESGKVLAIKMTTLDQRTVSTLNAESLASPVWSNGFLYVHDNDEKLHKIAAPA